MMSAHWDEIYGRPPLSRDAVLFVIALALHLPLLFLQFKAPVKPSGKNPSFVEIKMRDQAIERIVNQGMALPRSLPSVVVKRVDLRPLIKVRPALPLVLPPPRIRVDGETLLPSMVTPKLTPSVPKELQVVGTVGTVPDAAGLKDKGAFRAAPGTIESLVASGGSHPVLSGKSNTIVVPTGPIAQTESGIKSPTPLSGKILLSALPAGEPVMPKTAIKKDAHVGSSISMTAKPDVDLDSLPVIQPKPRTLTPEQRQKELFPIHGELKDRGIDHQEVPEMPEWARKKGIESSVKMRFSVTPDGRVKDNIELIRTSGYPELDELARTSLLRWVFTRLPPEKGNVVQDGVIEFKFSIK